MKHQGQTVSEKISMRMAAFLQAVTFARALD
jgi:hypothetical protein